MKLQPIGLYLLIVACSFVLFIFGMQMNENKYETYVESTPKSTGHNDNQHVATSEPSHQAQLAIAAYTQLNSQLQDIVEQVSYLAEKVEKVEKEASHLIQDNAINDDATSTRDNADVAEVSLSPEEEMAKQMAIINQTFEQQDFYSAWAQEAESRLQYAFSSQDLANHTIHSLECRTSLCKLEITSLNGTAGGFHEALRDQISDILPAGAMMPSENGVTVFLAQTPELLNTH